jgi:predicted O-methyltransferase YrrM
MEHGLAALNPVLQRILNERVVITEDGRALPLHSEISTNEGFFLQDVIRQNKPRVSLEIGCAYGIASLFICQALREVGAERHIIIDPFQIGHDHGGHDHGGCDPGYDGIGLISLKRAGYVDLICFYEELSHRCLPRLEQENCRIDFAFIDGMHTFDYALVDFFYIDKMLNVGGVAVFDDLPWPSIRKVCRYILRNLPYRAVGPTAAPTKGKKASFDGTRCTASAVRLGRYQNAGALHTRANRRRPARLLASFPTFASSHFRTYRKAKTLRGGSNMAIAKTS